MEKLVKRFLQLELYNWILISVPAAAVSLQTLSFQPAAQFLTTTAFILIEAVLLMKTLPEKNFEKLFNISQILLATFIIPEASFIAAVFLTSLIFALFTPIHIKTRVYGLAFTSHITDAASTVLGGKESNPLLIPFIERFGELPVLLSSKTVLVGLPLIYSYRELDGLEEKLFVRTVLLLGLTLSIRNFYLWVN